MPPVRVSKNVDTKEDSEDDMIPNIRNKRSSRNVKTLKIINEASKYLDDANSEAFYWKKIKITRLAPEVREQSAMACIDNKIYLFGGLSSDCLSDFFCLDTVKWRWEKYDTSSDECIVEPRVAHTVTVYKDQLLLYGGYK